MSRKGRTLSSFDEVADDININSEKNSENDIDLVSEILKGQRPKDETHIFKGFYLENEIADIIDNLAEGKPRGFKSELANVILKNYFKSEGLL